TITSSSLADLPEGQLRLDRPWATARRNFLPLGLRPIPRETRKFRRCRPPRCCGPQADARSIAFGRTIAIEAAVVAAR
ncbi:hypothetical protein, partial [Komagataeibacter oboediens]|uniref:hypothetical protein n=1 Tax=Komagataeibacter oboediens TaxID=65958 RepID=UPI0020B6E007